MAETEDDWRGPAQRLASFLVETGAMRDPRWVRCVAQAPRHEFIPRGSVLGVNGEVNGHAQWSRAQLLREAYTDQVVVTRYRSGPVNAVGERTRIATSSASQPSIMVIMLELLAVADGHRILEIGTGPGYNAYLLCSRVGDENVASVDIQADVVDEARRRLSRLGVSPHLVSRDGALGVPELAPFDRVIVTCGVSSIPVAWLDQLAPEARVVAPMNFGGALAVLDRQADGSLFGRFAQDSGFFMVMRSADDTDQAPEFDWTQEPIHSTTADTRDLLNPDFRLWLELSVLGVSLFPTRAADATPNGAMFTSANGRADLTLDDADSGSVTSSNADLWPQVEAVLADWIAHGRPARRRYGMTVTAQRQWVWLDEPDSQVCWELAGSGSGEF